MSDELRAAIEARRIEEVLHFTTNRGVLGMLAAGALLPRKQLEEDDYLGHVVKYNAIVRKDPAWTDCNSLSISRVNSEFFRISQAWHQHTDSWWAVVSFDPIVLTHDDVVFVTTNNIYPARKRGTGVEGLEALFADPVFGRYSTEHRRHEGMPDCDTTDIQAEILYPGPLSTNYLRRIYVVNYRHGDIVASQHEILSDLGDPRDTRPELPIDVRPEIFE
jgi:hypothetical protein